MTTQKKAQALTSVANDTPAEEILKIVTRDGGVIIKGFLTQEQIVRFNSEIEQPLRALAPGSTHENEIVAAFHGSNTKRLTNLVTHSATFRSEIIDHPLVHEISDLVFLQESGTYWMTTAQVIEIGPGNKAQMLHRDLENWFPFIGMGPGGPEVTINFLVALTDFTEENGATRVIPGSNHWSDFEDRGTPEQTIPAVMNAGDVLLFSGKTAHGGGANRTGDEYRRGLAFAFNAGFLTGEEAYPFLVDRELAKTLSPRVQRMLGFRSQYPTGSPGLWQVDYADLGDHLGL
ncbi:MULTISPECIES: phytanoyl-CoA dioxygenase family protein [Streptomyces]|uniref:Protein involved in biosynthesis of mitomycin antibiotics or polyketide fumonisin n=1 Tax=Streptomyces venezuelae (strain ATCC 10712 / CBS 650.69 / DSM 40230 / JCM 4526 / NBRC 13096 / PD 04745) TaxID=953739 RepID=F2RHV9_STRVP|nr:phytanoyl-CoA dioxygenase family protein [Streptomyces venezuelae]APE25441.1 phytanoyl-CoA dioxygenase [Streptomyces venezuelae]QES02778.1 phytanoyl-CoA dioxygenase family protein [Streptomyces venezuelae ATCC 10712]CCA60053.1 Protein involved in biosynthesis of mitomycin antibiotics or polyketide fumonisin [Streptomyces venezuelae ATCC 10712]